MNLKVLFFGATADAVGVRSMNIEAAAGSSSEEVFAEILGRHPRLAGHKLLFAVNEEYASGNETLKDGDELAVFTAVSGG